MDTRVEESNGPNRSQEGQNETPSGGPGRLVFHMTKHPASLVQRFPACNLSNWQGDDRSDDESDIHEDTEVLDLGHDTAEVDGADSVDNDQSDVGSVDNAVGCRPVTIASNRNACEDHRGEGICSHQYPVSRLFHLSFATITYSRQSKCLQSNPVCYCIRP